MISRGRILPSKAADTHLVRSYVAPGGTIRTDLPLSGGKTLKVVVLGARKVGKTSLIKNFLRGQRLNKNQAPTKNNDRYSEENYVINEKNFNLVLYDVAGGHEKIAEQHNRIVFSDVDLFIFCYA